MTRKKAAKTTGEPLEQPRVFSQEEINSANKALLAHFRDRLNKYLYREDMTNIKVSAQENRPLEPVYPKEGGDHIGYIQKGPQKLVITIEDFEHDGHVRGVGEAW